MTKAVGYVRVSTVGQADEGVSLAMQEAKIRAWAELNDVELISLHRDEGISGTKDNRPGLQAALETVKRKGCALVAYSMSRISRSTIQMLTLAEEIQKADGDLVSLQERIDTSSPTGKMIFRVMAAMGEFERDVISERTREAMAHMKDQGKRVGSIPYGFELADDGGNLRQEKREQEIIRHVRTLRDEGMSLRAISDELAARGVFSRNGKPFHPQTLSRIAA